MAKIWIEFEVEGSMAEEIGDGVEFFGEAEHESKGIERKICIDEAYFVRDWEDDNFFVFKFIKAFDEEK